MTKIVIDVSDWMQEYTDKGPDLRDEDALIQSRKTYTSAELARMYLAARAGGVIPPDILDTDKVILFFGARLRIGELTSRRKIDVETDHGTFTVSEFVPVEPETEDDKPGLVVDVQSELAVSSCIRYLTHQVAGRAIERLKIIAANGGDVRAAADALIASINGAVSELT